MSQTFEDSPVSDNRMDISEATTSQESAGVSPTIDSTISLTKNSSKKSEMNNSSLYFYSNSNCLTEATTKDNINVQNISNDNNVKLDNIPLDNDSPNILRLGQNLRQQNCNSIRASELMVANSHPLMSPPDTDSDSENGRRVFSFPDVVPENEPLRLANPSNRLHESKTCNTTKMMHQQDLDVTADCTSTSKMITTNTQTTSSQKVKTYVQRELSPDIISSESEQDLSQYQANVEPNYQSVTLISNNLNRVLKKPSIGPLTVRRKIPITADLLSDEMSSLDSISNHSFDDDDDMEHNLASLSPSSSVLDGFNDKYDVSEIETPTNAPPEPIPQYTAEDERRDSRNWQKITLPDGRVREIDMKVIEPYKRVLSHGGYLKAGGHNAIVMFCACHLPDRSRADYHYVMDNLFLYVVKTLDQLVTEDYVLIYLHGGSSRRNVPPFPWLKRCYQLLDRRLRKSLKNLYLVHPSFWLKSVVWMSRPFVSSKFWRKLVYVRSLEELYSMVSVEKAAIPDKVKQYDSKYT